MKGDERLCALRGAADKAADALNKMLADDNQFYRHAYTDKSSGETLETRLELANVKQFREMIGAIRDLTDAVRSLYDLPTLQEAEALKLNKRKLLLDEKKLTLDEKKLIQADAKDMSETGVVILPASEATQNA